MSSPSKTSRLDDLVAGRYQVLRYEQLPRPYQLAMAHYMAVDGEAWEDLLGIPRCSYSKEFICRALKAALPRYVQRYGAEFFGVACLPTSAVLTAVIQDPEISQDWTDWQAYHAWYCSSGSGRDPNHPRRNRWPVILSSTDDETLQDGWHRLHCYVRQRARTIPAIFYPQSRHLGARNAPKSSRTAGQAGVSWVGA